MKNRRFIPLILYVVILIAAFSWLGEMFRTDVNQIPYSEVVELFRQEQVKSFVVEDDVISLELHIGVDHGVNICAVSRSIMSEVSYKLSKSTGVPVKKVDVYVDTIIG